MRSLLLISSLWLAPTFANGLPHLGVRYTLFPTNIYEARAPHNRKAEKLPAHSAIVPCVVMENGSPLKGSKGQPLLGYNIVYTEPKLSQKVSPSFSSMLEPLHKIDQERQAQNQNLRDAKKQYPANQIVPHMNCPDKIDGVIDLASLFPEARKVTYLPPPLISAVSDVASGFKSSFEKTDCCTPEPSHVSLPQLVREFHNSAYCTHIETALGGRKSQLLQNWKNFIAEKLKTHPNLEPDLTRAMQADVAARTALYEGNPEEGCSDKGICEKDIILLSIRNRAQDSRCERKGGFKLYGCKKPGDIVGVATPEDQYNIWNENIADTTYITSCFLRDDVHPKSKIPAVWPAAEQAEKNSYQRQVLVFEQTLDRAEKILFSSNPNNLFSGNDAERSTDIQHYYHPGAMSTCMTNHANLLFINAGYAERDGHYFPVRKEYARVTDAGDDFYSMERLKRDSRGTIDPIDDIYSFEKDFDGARIPKNRFSKVEVSSKCTPYGLSLDCKIQDAKYYRTIPNWLKTGYIPDIKCKSIPSSGTQCQDRIQQKSDVVVSGKCQRSFAPVAGVP